MDKPTIEKENISNVFDSRFIKVFGMEYVEGRPYMNATRRKLEDLVALKQGDDFKKMLADAVSCIVIINGEEPRLLMNYEFRYPIGQYLLSIPAGLIDPADRAKDEPLIETAKRELKEETNLELRDGDRIWVLNRAVFSTPGMTDESNALVVIVINNTDGLNINQSGAEGGECFNGYTMLSKADALRILKQGTDDNGIYYSVYTFVALSYFVTELWK